jgi:hypothetical protein
LIEFIFDGIKYQLIGFLTSLSGDFSSIKYFQNKSGTDLMPIDRKKSSEI